MKNPTNPLWYLAAFTIALGSFMIAAVVAAGGWQPVRDATVIQAGPTIDAKGSSIAVFTDLVQPERDVSCRVTGPGKKSSKVKESTIDITVSTDGTPWTLIGVLDKGRDGARLKCTPKDKRVDDAEYGFAVFERSRANTADGILSLGVVTGLGLAGYTYYQRRQRKGAPS